MNKLHLIIAAIHNATGAAHRLVASIEQAKVDGERAKASVEAVFARTNELKFALNSIREVL